ncbi:hypothetical protein DER44DRAFT_765249 [Fusarium oxysporum]|nr:hypothetical protein DER44DRAFT_765249 [Fusarium oxysporum]
MAETEAHVANERKLQRAKTFIEAASPEVWSTVLRVHENAKSNTSAAKRNVTNLRSYRRTSAS